MMLLNLKVASNKFDSFSGLFSSLFLLRRTFFTAPHCSHFQVYFEGRIFFSLKILLCRWRIFLRQWKIERVSRH